jgi:dipeptide/tripeptide permease
MVTITTIKEQNFHDSAKNSLHHLLQLVFIIIPAVLFCAPQAQQNSALHEAVLFLGRRNHRLRTTRR